MGGGGVDVSVFLMPVLLNGPTHLQLISDWFRLFFFPSEFSQLWSAVPFCADTTIFEVDIFIAETRKKSRLLDPLIIDLDKEEVCKLLGLFSRRQFFFWLVVQVWGGGLIQPLSKSLLKQTHFKLLLP